jgi:hypothetical protein
MVHSGFGRSRLFKFLDVVGAFVPRVTEVSFASTELGLRVILKRREQQVVQIALMVRVVDSGSVHLLMST